MEERVDIGSASSVQRMFEELDRDHRAAGPAVPTAKAAGPAATPPPPRRRGVVPSFWTVGDEATRIAELRVLLAEPDVSTPAPAYRAPRPPHLTTSAPHQAGWTLAPVAIAPRSAPAMAGSLRLEPALLRWIVPAAAGAVAAGAFVAGEVVRPPALVPAGLTNLQPDAPPQSAPGWRDAESYSAWTLELMRRPSLLARPAARTVEFAEHEVERSGAGDETRPASVVVATAATLAPEQPRPATLRSAAAAPAPEPAPRSTQHDGEAPAPSPYAALPAADESTPSPFDQQAALAALRTAAGAAQSCADSAGGTLLVPVTVTFAPSGRVTVAQVGGALAGKPAGSCVAQVFRTAVLPPFAGPLTTVTKTVRFR